MNDCVWYFFSFDGFWKYCPMTWLGSFKGKEKVPTIVMEALSAYHMWFWNENCDYTGTLNNINIIEQSQYVKDMCNGQMNHLKRRIGCPSL